MPSQSISPGHLFLAVLVSALWGLSFVSAKIVVDEIPTFAALTLRFGIVSVMLLPFYLKPQLPFILLLRISLSFALLHLGCMFWSLEVGLSSSIAVVAEQLGIPILLILNVIFFGEKVGLRSIIGITLAIIGTFFLMGSPDSIESPWGFVLILGSALFWATYSLEARKAKDASILATVAWVSVIALPVMALLSYLFEENQIQAITQASTMFWFSVAYMVLGVSIASHGLWYFLLTRNSTETVAPIILLVPLFGVIGSVVILGESINFHMIVGTLLMLTGLAIVMIRRPKILKKDTSFI